jgi:hypothetical protein
LCRYCTKAASILESLEKSHPELVSLQLRRINLERRRSVCTFGDHGVRIPVLVSLQLRGINLEQRRSVCTGTQCTLLGSIVNGNKAALILESLEKAHPELVNLQLRRINLERRRTVCTKTNCTLRK